MLTSPNSISLFFIRERKRERKIMYYLSKYISINTIIFINYTYTYKYMSV